MGDENFTKASGCSFARFLGVISPKISTATVMTTVDIVGARLLSEMISRKRTVPREDTPIFTILFPISMVERSLSYLSESFRTSLARLSPFSAKVLNFVLLKDVNAVSVAEKYPDIIISITIMAIVKGMFMVMF